MKDTGLLLLDTSIVCCAVVTMYAALTAPLGVVLLCTMFVLFQYALRWRYVNWHGSPD